jgi:hypothetical protein
MARRSNDGRGCRRKPGPVLFVAHFRPSVTGYDRHAFKPSRAAAWLDPALDRVIRSRWELGLKILVPLLLIASLGACDRISEYTSPSPRDLLAHAGWFDGRQVTVCGDVKHGLGSCTLEICAHGDGPCSEPVPAWLSTKSECYAGESARTDKAMVTGHFLDFSNAQRPDGTPAYAIAGADVAFVAGCDSNGHEPVPDGARP